MLAVVAIASVLAGAALPIIASLAGARLRTSLVLACLPSMLLAIGWLVSFGTAWGARSADGSEDVSNSYALGVASLLALMAGALAFALAALITRVRGGNAWSRRA
ncbi:MAG: hypothetical protein ABI317_07115 [Gaiellales bacterium]